MGSILLRLILTGTVGIFFAATSWLGLIALGNSAWDQVEILALLIGVGILSAVAMAFLMTVLRRPVVAMPRSEHPPARPVEPTTRKAKPRKHPLERGRCRARISADLRWSAVSASLASLLNRSRNQLRGQSVVQILHPEDVHVIDQAFARAKATRRVQHVLCRLVKKGSSTHATPKSGSTGDTATIPKLTPDLFFSVRIDIWAHIDRASRLRSFHCTILDLTPILAPKELQIRMTQKYLAKVKRRWRVLGQDLHRLKVSYRELYHHAPVMYFSVDSEGRLVTINDTLLNTLGYQRQELQGQEYTRLLAPATLKSYVTIAGSMPSQERVVETQWRKKDGAVIDVWLHSTPVYDESGNFVRYRSAALDLTERSRLANELRSRGDELERTNASLRAINNELEAFTHVVSHDLKEPLRTLQAYSHLLAQEHAAQLGPDGFQYVNHLIRASRRLGALIDDLLSLSQAGRLTRGKQVFNINSIVATVRQDLVDLIQRKQAIILTEGALPDVTGDSVRITQLITNLVANGLKYNQDATPRVTIGSAACDDDPRRVTIYVRDNGIGIDPAFHEQIFGIFRRLHKNEEYEGTGAGLAICKKIVEGHGGRIWVESMLGQGATFFISLPRPVALPDMPASNGQPRGLGRKAAAEAAAVRQRKTGLYLEKPNGNTSQLRIVLVEDQSDVGLIIQKLGQRDGLAISWFPTAEEAWAYLQDNCIDLLLLDINLPGISGLDLCKRLRTLPHFKDTSVAVFTPRTDPEHLQTLTAAGADFFLTKDLLCQPAEWQRKIQELLAQIRHLAAH